MNTEMKSWYKSGIRLTLFFLIICYFVTIIFPTTRLYIGYGLIITGIWQFILTLTGHYK